MGKKFLLIFLFLSPLLYIGVNAQTQIIRTDIKINLETFLDANNETKANLTIETENSEGEKDYKKFDAANISGETFTIRLIKNIDEINVFNLTKYFTECDGVLCKDKVQQCEEGKNFIAGAKQECDAQLTNVSSYVDLYVSSTAQVSSLNTRIENLTGDLESLKKDEGKDYTPLIFIAGFGIGWFIWGRKKKQKTIEEIETGISERLSPLREEYADKAEG